MEERKFNWEVSNIGCGLDTSFERVDNGSVTWYDLDMPDVIELRRQFIQETNRRHFIAKSVFDPTWYEQITAQTLCLFLVAGVIYYFSAEQVKQLLVDLLNTFQHYEMVFDYCSPRGVKVANKRVIDDSGMDQSAYLQWGVEDIKILESWDNRLKVVSDFPMFTKFYNHLSIGMKLPAAISDWMKIMSLAHIKA